MRTGASYYGKGLFLVISLPDGMTVPQSFSLDENELPKMAEKENV